MQTKKINEILKEILKKIEPPEEDVKIIENSLKDSLEKIENNIKKSKINAEIFVGGSFAKKTMIKKDYYDVDVFLRFDKKYSDEEMSELTTKILKDFPNVATIHGSRDYFKIKISPSFFIEIIPVTKVKTPKHARNITDLSYSHVKYVKNKIKTNKILEDIKLAKVFCYANNCYGAESYIKGFSGYGLELLIYHYKSFLKFIKEVAKAKDKIIIDLEKHYKNKSQILMDVNSSKLNSPIILIDPTYKQRNALAALSNETFKKFQEACKKFLQNPSVKSFERKKIDLQKIKTQAEKNKFEFILLEIKTQKQEGDIAGTKLLKFYNHLETEISKLFDIKNKGFNYNGKKSARVFFVVKNKKEILFEGPNIKDKKNFAKFKKKHKNTFEKKSRIYSKEKVKINIKNFLNKWKLKNKRKVKEMGINELKLFA